MQISAVQNGCKIKILLLLLMCVGGLQWGCANKAPSVTDKQAEAINALMDSPQLNTLPKDIENMPEFIPQTLCDAFEKDRRMADALYGDKWIKLRGRVAYGPVDMGVPGVNSYYLGLGGGSKKVACIFFGKRQRERLSQLAMGQTVVVIGVYSTEEKYVPKLIGCTILSADK